MGRICAQCDRDLPRTSYTPNQYSKGEGVSRCATCVHGTPYDNSSHVQYDSGRYNKASNAEFETDELDNPFASGAFRWVAKGKYTKGERAGQACVTKWFKTGAVFSQDYFALDIKAINKALDLVNRFSQLGIVNKMVQINVAQVWQFEDDGFSDWAGQRSLVEPFIQNYQKFNSNTGWTDESRDWGKVMQALSHFSYHISGGNFVLCDLQGGIYQHEVVLSDPVILSRTREYGVTDLGSDGITSFFSHHTCNGVLSSQLDSSCQSSDHFPPSSRHNHD